MSRHFTKLTENFTNDFFKNLRFMPEATCAKKLFYLRTHLLYGYLVVIKNDYRYPQKSG